jgi:hypothetical protein
MIWREASHSFESVRLPLWLERDSSLHLDIVRLRGLDEFRLRHPEPSVAANGEQDRFDFPTVQHLTFSFVGNMEHAIHAHLHFIFRVPTSCSR